jgi:hypothetical protein
MASSSWAAVNGTPARTTTPPRAGAATDSPTTTPTMARMLV